MQGTVIEGGFQLEVDEGDAIWEMCYALLKNKEYEDSILICFDEVGSAYSEFRKFHAKPVPRIDKLFDKVKDYPFLVIATRKDNGISVEIGYDTFAYERGEVIFKIQFMKKNLNQDVIYTEREDISKWTLDLYKEAKRYL